MASEGGTKYLGGEGRVTGEERGAWTSGGQGIRGVMGQAAGEEAQDGARRDRADSGQGAAGGGADGSGRVATRVGASDCQTRPLQIEREKLKLICSLIKRFLWWNHT